MSSDAPEAPPLDNNFGTLTGEIERVKESEENSPDIAHGESVGEGIFRVNHITREARDPGLPAERRDNGPVLADFRFTAQSPREQRPQDPFVAEVLVESQFIFGMQGCHLGARTRAAGGAINR